MHIPENLYFSTFQFHSSIIFLLIGILISAFIFWFEGVKDGFDYERLLDLFFIIFISTGVLSYLLIWFLSTKLYLSGEDYFFVVTYVAFSLNFLLISYFSNLWVWSFFRISDISAIAFSFLYALFALSQYLIYDKSLSFIYFCIGLFLAIVGIIFRRKIFSGFLYSIFLFIYVASSFLLFKNLDNLIFYTVLITIGVSTLVRRKNIGTYYGKFKFRPKFYSRSKR